MELANIQSESLRNPALKGVKHFSGGACPLTPPALLGRTFGARQIAKRSRFFLDARLGLMIAYF